MTDGRALCQQRVLVEGRGALDTEAREIAAPTFVEEDEEAALPFDSLAGQRDCMYFCSVNVRVFLCVNAVANNWQRRKLRYHLFCAPNPTSSTQTFTSGDNQGPGEDPIPYHLAAD